MENKINLAAKSECTGCAVCIDSCPKHCLKFKRDGIHLYPSIDVNVCIGCHRCEKACPVINRPVPKVNMKHTQSFYCGWSRDNVIRRNGTSGGVGTALALYAHSQGYAIVGAAFDVNWHLQQKLTTRIDVVNNFCGSKYLHSDARGCYDKVLDALGKGQKVLFFGTPCQCEAIRNYIGDKSRSNLITCAILCHGVNSSVVWEDYVAYIEKNAGSKLVDYNFRSKSHGWLQARGGGGKLRVARKFANGKNIDEPSWHNLFHHWFGHHYIMREACFECPYREEQRNSDITIGDFWGVRNVLPDLDTIDGVTVVITSTSAGDNLLKKCDAVTIVPVDRNKSIVGLKGIINKTPKNIVEEQKSERAEFEATYIQNDFEYMAKKYPADTYVLRIIKSLQSRLKLH